MIDLSNVYTNVTGSGLAVVPQNATGAGLTDGTEFVAAGLANGPEFGFMQAIMDYGSGGTNAPTGTVGIPNGVSDGLGVSQIIEAMQRGLAVGPGKMVGWWLNDDPSVTLDRVLLLQGQGVLVATYPDLTAEVYVGDGNNVAAQAVGAGFFKSSTADGLNPIDGGAYLILPESRGYALRGLDLAASVDPDGATRLLGDNQVDAGQRITGTSRPFLGLSPADSGVFSLGAAGPNTASSGANSSNRMDFNSANSTSPNTAKTNDVETRMSNLSIQFGITY